MEKLTPQHMNKIRLIYGCNIKQINDYYAEVMKESNTGGVHIIFNSEGIVYDDIHIVNKISENSLYATTIGRMMCIMSQYGIFQINFNPIRYKSANNKLLLDNSYNEQYIMDIKCGSIQQLNTFMAYKDIYYIGDDKYVVAQYREVLKNRHMHRVVDYNNYGTSSEYVVMNKIPVVDIIDTNLNFIDKDLLFDEEAENKYGITYYDILKTKKVPK